MQPPKSDAQVQCIPSSSSLLPRGSLVLGPVAVAASLLASSASILALSLALGKKTAGRPIGEGLVGRETTKQTRGRTDGKTLTV